MTTNNTTSPENLYNIAPGRSLNQHRQDGTKTAPAVLFLCPCRFLTLPPEI